MAAEVTVRWVEDGAVRVGTDADLASAAAAACPVWVDVLRPDQAAFAPLAARFDIHPLAIEDCLHFPQRVKMDLYANSAFMVWVFPQVGVGDDVRELELDVIFGERFLITSHRDAIPVLDEIAADPGGILCRGTDWTLHSLLDRGVDELFPLVDRLAETLDDLEDTLMDDPGEEALRRLYSVKRALVRTYRSVAGERDVLRSMARRQEFVSQDAYLYFQDVGDHLARAVDAIDTYRDVASGAMDIYLSSVNNRTNAIMKQLTVVATIFMPLSFITGIYGMNLLIGMWPAPDSPWGFAVVIGSMVVITAGMLWFFKKRSWW